jgi:hypothetical protein
VTPTGTAMPTGTVTPTGTATPGTGGAPSNIPTLSFPMLVLLGVLLGASGLFLSRRS